MSTFRAMLRTNPADWTAGQLAQLTILAQQLHAVALEIERMPESTPAEQDRRARWENAAITAFNELAGGTHYTRHDEGSVTFRSGEDWKAVQTYLGSRAPKPTTVEGWFSAAEAVRDTHRMPTMPATTEEAPPPSDTDRPQDEIADVEPAPPSPAEHTSAHTVSHAQPRPRSTEPPIATGSRARSAARRALK